MKPHAKVVTIPREVVIFLANHHRLCVAVGLFPWNLSSLRTVY